MVEITRSPTASLVEELDKDIIELSREPKATTDVIPYRDGDPDFVGKTVHVLYQCVDDETGEASFQFYKGVISRKLREKNTYRLDFHDGDRKDVNVVKPEEVILWETGDITKGGRWKTEEEGAGVAGVGRGGAAKLPDVPRGKATDPEDDTTIRDLRVEERARSIAETKLSSAEKTDSKRLASMASRQAPGRRKVDEVTELRASIQTVGKEFLGALRSLQTAANQINTLNTTLKTFMLRSDVQVDQLAAIAKGVRGLVNHVLRPKTEFRNANDMGLERVWPLNDAVMIPVSALCKTAGALCQRAALPPIADGGVLDAWRASKQEVRPEQGAQNNNALISPTEGDRKKRNRDQGPLDEVTPVRFREVGQSPMSRDGSIARPPKQPKREYDIFPSTGSNVRDDALRILAHSLMISAATPYELAVDMEAAIYKRFPPGEKGAFPDEYYSSVMGARDILSVESDRYRQAVRLMMLEGFISPDDLISGDNNELEAKLAAFREKLV